MRSILQAPESLSAIEAEAVRLMLVPPGLEGPGFEGTMGFFVEGDGTLIDTDTVRVRDCAINPSIAFDQASDLTAYHIGDHVWCTARWMDLKRRQLTGRLTVERLRANGLLDVPAGPLP